MPIKFESYAEQVKIWPREGRRILAQFDEETIVVYQAYRPSIARHAATHRAFGGGFSYERMSWIKPNFLWMVYRSGWGTKPDQEATLALRLRRSFFDELLRQAVPSSFQDRLFPSQEAWSAAVAHSEVRSQWDPDHHPNGAKQERRAIQLGLRGRLLARYGREELVEVVDVSEFVAAQRAILAASGAGAIQTPRERVYIPADPEIAGNLGLDPWP